MAARYARVDTSDLRRKVEPGPNLFVFDLERAEPVEAEAEQDAEATKEKATEEDDSATEQSAPEAGSAGEATADEPTAESSPAAGEVPAP
jgi:hypothetical protein